MRLRTTWLTMTVLAMTAVPVLAVNMYGGGSGQQSGQFGIVDQTTGVLTVLGDPTAVNGQGLSGIAFGTDGRLWGSVSLTVGTRLIEISPTTGTLLQDVGVIQVTTPGDIRIVDLAIQPSTNALFGITSSGVIYTINKQTAVATLVGDPGQGKGGIAFAPDGTFYLVENDGSTLWTIDPFTGATIDSVAITAPCLDGLAVRPSDGTLFATECDGRQIVRIDPTTFDTQVIDPGDDADDVADLAFQLFPAQHAPALSFVGSGVLGAALLLVGLRRSRRC